MTALYHRDGFRFEPTALTRGPWSPDAQHGGPPACLLAYLIQEHENGPEMFLSRTTVDLLRPVPLTPLIASVRTTRPGRKVQLVEASLWTGPNAGEGVEVVRAVGLRIRRGAVTLPASALGANSAVDLVVDEARSIGRPSDGRRWPQPGESAFGSAGFHADAVELRFVHGAPNLIGPGTMWGRLLVPLFDDVVATGVPLALALSDFGNAASSVVTPDRWGFINADLTVSLHRDPVGEWISLDAITRVSSIGVGVASALLSDLDGPIGRCVASLLIEPR